jgi:hypothetical protein
VTTQLQLTNISYTAAFPSVLNPILDLCNFNDHFKQRPAFASAVMDFPHYLALYTSSPLTAEEGAQFLTRSFGVLLGEVGLGEVSLKVL